MKFDYLIAIMLILTPVTMAQPQQSQTQCQRSLAQSSNNVATLTGCQALIEWAEKGHSEGYYQLGLLMLADKDKQRVKRGLFYLVLAADENHAQAIAALSDYVKNKMVDGKIPLRFSHYVSYLEMDWRQKGKPQSHHFAQYEHWLNQVETAQLEPQTLDADTLSAMAVDFDNGYFVGANPEHATRLYRLAADKGNTLAQYKLGEKLYPTDKASAINYLQQAAKNSSAEAMLKLGEHFGCLGQKSLALQWFETAKKHGNEYAQDEIDSVSKNGKPTLCQ